MELIQQGSASRSGATSQGDDAIIVEAGHQGKRGMVLPFEQHCITFDDVRYSVDMPLVSNTFNLLIFPKKSGRLRNLRVIDDNKKTILQEMKAQGITEDRLELLKGVSGAFRPGVLTALMGVSGAGKTTLMDVLAGRKTGGYIEGDIRISGYPKKQETFARISGYCEQNDIHSPHVTVHESLLYSAWLRLSPDIDSKTREVSIVSSSFGSN